MDPTPDISVIVPIYNIEQYLTQCLDSISANFKHCPNVEVLLINDGSTDNSSSIASFFCNQDNRFTLYNKENGGLSDARNYGLERAKGKYIFFIDSDDWISESSLIQLLSLAESGKYDIVISGFSYVYRKRKLSTQELYPSFSKSICTWDKLQAMSNLIDCGIFKNFAWGKLYHRDVINQHLFPKGVFFEDAHWMHLIVDNASRVAVIPDILYFYRQRKTSISGRFSEKNIDLLKGLESRILFFNKYYHALASKQTDCFIDILITLYCESRCSIKKSIRYAYQDIWNYYNSIWGERINTVGINNQRYRDVCRFPHAYPLISLFRKIAAKLK